MSIRLLAQALYRLTREVERLERALAQADPARRAAIAETLRRAAADRDRLRGALEGKKDPGSRRPS